eukprot:9386965-Pyramimonas_sp.AAC.2
MATTNDATASPPAASHTCVPSPKFSNGYKRAPLGRSAGTIWRAVPERQNNPRLLYMKRNNTFPQEGTYVCLRFHDFLEKMRHPYAADLVRAIKRLPLGVHSLPPAK